MLSDLLTLGSRWTFVGGKGGVGKTTTAAALAVELADRGERVLVLSADPAHSLGDALALPLGPEPSPVPGAPGLTALELDARRERDAFLEDREALLLEVMERGTYLERSDVEGFADLAVPGMDELAALFRLVRLADEPGARVVIDTAPTGHTLRLLALPRVARGWLGALQAMDEKHRTVAAALSGVDRADAATGLLAGLDADLARLEALLSDPGHTRFVLVTTREPVVLAETRRLEEALTALHVALGGVVVNRSDVDAADRPPDAAGKGKGMAFVPLLERDPRGVDALRDFATAARDTPPPAPGSAAADSGAPPPRAGGPFRPPLDRDLYLVGGKGGVGKTTAAAALALLLTRERGVRVLVMSTDPAGSLGDVLGVEVGAEPVPVPDAPGLHARQVDAGAAWDDFREQYRRETSELFAGLLSAGADHRVVERLVDLAPPGIDELVALLEVVDVTEDRPYDALVLDTAPTGHLLRLLEMPAIALDWTHALLRLLLKYREVVPLGELAERVLRLSRSLRALREHLSDGRRSWFLAVALPEALSVPETERLLRRLRAIGIEPGALLVNRALDPAAAAVLPRAAAPARALVELSPALPCAAAPALQHGPGSPEELRRFAEGWRVLEGPHPPGDARGGRARTDD